MAVGTHILIVRARVWITISLKKVTDFIKNTLEKRMRDTRVYDLVMWGKFSYGNCLPSMRPIQDRALSSERV
jgi:hypothetical protein